MSGDSDPQAAHTGAGAPKSSAPSSDRIETALEGSGAQNWDEDAPIPAPLNLYRTPVRHAWVDYNAHMSESVYLYLFGNNSDAFFRYIGIGEEYRSSGGSLYTVETHIHNRREAAEDDPLRLTLRVLDHDGKRVHIFHEMYHESTGTLLATAEQMLVHVDSAQGGSAPMPAPIADRVDAIQRAHAALGMPDVVGRPMGIRH